jgi:hypothetical protein
MYVLYMYIFMNARYVYMHACTMLLCMRVRMYDVCEYICTMYAYVCTMHAYTYVRTYVCMYEYSFIYVYLHVCMWIIV